MFEPTAGRPQLDINSLLVNIYIYIQTAMLGTREYTLCSPFKANAHNSSYYGGRFIFVARINRVASYRINVFLAGLIFGTEPLHRINARFYYSIFFKRRQIILISNNCEIKHYLNTCCFIYIVREAPMLFHVCVNAWCDTFSSIHGYPRVTFKINYERCGTIVLF